MKKSLSILHPAGIVFLFLLVGCFGCAHKKTISVLEEPKPGLADSGISDELADAAPVEAPAAPTEDEFVEENGDFDDFDNFDDFEESGETADPPGVQVADPFEPWNRAMYHSVRAYAV